MTFAAVAGMWDSCKAAAMRAILSRMHPQVTSLLGHFRFLHLPKELQEVARGFAELAYDLATEGNLSGPELTRALSLLLQSKDAALRAALPNEENPGQSLRRELARQA